MKLQNIQIVLIRLALAGLFLNLGFGKYNGGWLQNSTPLVESLQNYEKNATGIHFTYLATVAIPYVSTWSKLITIGELGIGISLLIGALVRFSSAVGIFMVLNFHAATGNLYSLSFFGSPWAVLFIVCLLVTLLSGAGRWIGIDQLLAKSNSKSVFW